MDDKVDRIRARLLGWVEVGPGLRPDVLDDVGRLLYGADLNGLGPEVDLWRGRTMTHFRVYFGGRSPASEGDGDSLRGRLLQAIHRLGHAVTRSMSSGDWPLAWQPPGPGHPSANAASFDPR